MNGRLDRVTVRFFRLVNGLFESLALQVRVMYCFRLSSPGCLIIALSVMQLSGCSSYDKWKEGRPKTYFTSGTVLLDGKPVAGAIITFQPIDGVNGKPGSALTDSNGYFEAQTFDPGDGLTEGTHRVAIKKTQMIDRATGKVVTEVTTDAPLKEDYLVPQKYSDFSSSKIDVNIQAKSNKLEPFQLSK